MDAQKPDTSNAEDFYGLLKPQNLLYTAKSRDPVSWADSTQTYEDSGRLFSESIVWFPDRWNQGEGGIDWRGSSSQTGRQNFFRVDWSTQTLHGFVSQVTNLNNDYQANVGYFFRTYSSKGGSLLREYFLIVCRVADEDFYSPPSTVYDSNKLCVTDAAFGYIEIQQQVSWG